MTRIVSRLAIGLIANTVATIAVGIGAVEPAFGNVTLTDTAGRLIKNSADRPVPILQAPAEAIRVTLLRALPTRGGEIVVPFPQFARGLHRRNQNGRRHRLTALAVAVGCGLSFTLNVYPEPFERRASSEAWSPPKKGK